MEAKVKIASCCDHHGEEPMISGTKGSGTIFFSGCCLRCVYCQNYQISQEKRQDKQYSIGEVVALILKLQEQGVHNINFVSPTHYGQQVVEIIKAARQEGLNIPIVYNTGGYDSLPLLRSFEGLVDVYLPDFKYYDDTIAYKYSGVKNYVRRAKEGIAEMFRQVGNIKLNDSGLSTHGLLVRHLVLPNGLSQSMQVLSYLASISKDIWVSIMSQYRPQYKTGNFPELSRKLTAEEYSEIVEYAQRIGLHNLYIQELESSETYLPNFQKEKPFN